LLKLPIRVKNTIRNAIDNFRKILVQLSFFFLIVGGLFMHILGGCVMLNSINKFL